MSESESQVTLLYIGRERERERERKRDRTKQILFTVRVQSRKEVREQRRRNFLINCQGRKEERSRQDMVDAITGQHLVIYDQWSPFSM